MKVQSKKIIQFIELCTAILCSVIILKNNKAVTQGARNGIELCMHTVVPALFPMLALSSFLSLLQYPDAVNRILFFPMKRISGLPSSAAPAFIFGALNGYPVGVKTAVSLFNENRLDLYSAQKSALINIYPGIVFSVFVTGRIYFGSTILGFILYSAVSLSNLLLCLTLQKHKKSHKQSEQNRCKSIPLSDAFVNAVHTAISSITSICAWIVLFSSFTAPLQDLSFYKIINLLAEVTNAVTYCASVNNLPLCAFCMGFSGICIFLQLLPDLKKLCIRPTTYFLYRLLSGGISYSLTALILRIIPVSMLTSASSRVLLQPVSVSISGTSVFIFFCVVFMLSVMKTQSAKNFVHPLDYKKKI